MKCEVILTEILVSSEDIFAQSNPNNEHVLFI